MEKYIAHIDKQTNRQQTVLEHLEGTAKRAACFARPFGAFSIAYYCGMLHDIGKYSAEFQKRIMYGGEKVDHSTAGALEAFKNQNAYAAFCIAGHHGGLPDMGARLDLETAPTLIGKMKREPGKDIPDYSAFRSELKVTPAEAPPFLQKAHAYRQAFFTRMLYSCLVDADFLDTEAFMHNHEREKNCYQTMPELMQKLHNYLGNLPNQEKAINKKRHKITEECRRCGEREVKGIFQLTVPTGGGKTLSSLEFAMSHAVAQGMERIIYIIPYTNIIEQTAEIFRHILGSENVLEHHSSVDYEPANEGEESELLQRAKLATENWDSPVIVTTAVQFFNSLYANKPSRCRKLHNIVNSVLIFDEAQMMAVPYLLPCIEAIKELVAHYGCSAVLCTATQPSLDRFFKPMKIKPIYAGTANLYQFFRRVQFCQLGQLTDEQLAERLNGHPQALCIVNNRAQAQQVYGMLEKTGSYHLSTLMTPTHRKRILDEIKIRLGSEEQEPCRVVSTSLIEAGVDIDFPTVYRAMAGLDSILQAAGRCNREGKRPREESIVYIFDTEAGVAADFCQNIAAAEDILRRYPEFDTAEVIQAYFQFLYYMKGSEALDEKGILSAFEHGINGAAIPFKQVAKRFQLIEARTRPVFIPFQAAKKADEKVNSAQELIKELRYGCRSRGLMRKLNMYAVNIFEPHFKELLDCGALEVLETGEAILLREDCYSEHIGLLLKPTQGQALVY